VTPNDLERLKQSLDQIRKPWRSPGVMVRPLAWFAMPFLTLLLCDVPVERAAQLAALPTLLVGGMQALLLWSVAASGWVVLQLNRSQPVNTISGDNEE
jgi:hypothetical protein